MRTYKLCIKRDGDSALLDPAAEGFVFAFVALRLKEPPRGKFRLRCELGKLALNFEEDLPVDQGAPEPDPVHVSQASGATTPDFVAKQFIFMMPGSDLGLDDQLPPVFT